MDTEKGGLKERGHAMGDGVTEDVCFERGGEDGGEERVVVVVGGCKGVSCGGRREVGGCGGQCSRCRTLLVSTCREKWPWRRWSRRRTARLDR